MDHQQLEAPSVALNLDSNYSFDSVGWAQQQSPGMAIPLPLLGSPSFPSSLSDSMHCPTWQLDHAPSWQPESHSSPFVSSFLSPLPLSNPALPTESSHLLPPTTDDLQPQDVSGAVDDFNGTFLSLLGSPSGGMGEPLRLGEDEEEQDALAVQVKSEPVDIYADGEESGSGSSSEDDSDEEEEQQSSVAVAEVSLPPATLFPMDDFTAGEASDVYAHAYALAQSAVDPSYGYAPQVAFPDPYSALANSSVMSGLEGEHDDGSVSSPRFHGSGDEETPPTSNSSDHDHTRSPYPHQYQTAYDYKAAAAPSALGAAPSHFFYPALEQQHQMHAGTPSTTYEDPLDHEDEKPFIPALSRPRSAHLRQSYANEEREIDRLLADADPDFDFSNEELLSSAGSKKRKRSASSHSTHHHTNLNMAWAPPPPATARRSTSTEAHDAMSIASGSGSVASGSTSKSKKSKKSKAAYADGTSSSSAAARKRTEIPAVEDDPTIRPYGCNYDHCPSRARVAAKGGPSAIPVGPNGEIDEQDAISWRTVRELREHCAEHRRLGLDGGQLPFRCALDPCGKTFKSLAGLRFHFQNASANGHFFVSHEEGEVAPTKKFKACVQPTERSEKCPVAGCSKAFKQAAGLAYHLAHTAGHDMTEEMVSGFAATLQSKTRWWYAKMGRALG